MLTRIELPRGDRRPEPGRPGLVPDIVAAGGLEVRLAKTADEVAAAQGLRYRVFYEEMTARPSAEVKASRRDCDRFDAYCEHLLVIDHRRPASEVVVGTYRLLRHDVAERHGGFYSAGEYDLAPLLSGPAAGRGLLEVGRSCVDKAYRTNATIQLLWRGIARYLSDHDIGYLFGCASFPGTDPSVHAMALTYLYRSHLAPTDVRVAALPSRHARMDLMAPETVSLRAALHALPPLIKGYLRLGAYVGDGAVVDRDFGTTDVFILLDVAQIADRYVDRYVAERSDRERALTAG
jgi:putative hemolysin